jgi:hypothetical protein
LLKNVQSLRERLISIYRALAVRHRRIKINLKIEAPADVGGGGGGKGGGGEGGLKRSLRNSRAFSLQN